mgnify:FL=1
MPGLGQGQEHQKSQSSSLNADLAPGLVVAQNKIGNNETSFGTLDIKGSTQRFSMLEPTTSDKNDMLKFNISSKYQPGAVAQAQSTQQISSKKMTIGSSGMEYESSDKENKFKQQFNPRMSKYGQNQFRPSAVINSTAMAGGAANINGMTIGGGSTSNTLGRGSSVEDPMKQNYGNNPQQSYIDSTIQHQEPGSLEKSKGPFRQKYSSKLENYESHNQSPISFKRDDNNNAPVASGSKIPQDDFLEKMINQDNVYQNARAGAGVGNQNAKPSGGQNEFGYGTFYKKQQL